MFDTIMELKDTFRMISLKNNYGFQLWRKLLPINSPDIQNHLNLRLIFYSKYQYCETIQRWNKRFILNSISGKQILLVTFEKTSTYF